MDILVLGFFYLAFMHLCKLKSFSRSENILQAKFYVMLIAPLYFVQLYNHEINHSIDSMLVSRKYIHGLLH